jgi:hypothetical protein
VNYIPDANDLAARQERREQKHLGAMGGKAPVWGMFSVWQTLKEVDQGLDPWIQIHCFLELKDSGLIVAYDDDGNAEIYSPAPGWYMNFVPDRQTDEGQ